MIRQVDPLVSLPAVDMRRAVRFYTEVLGLELQFQAPDETFCIFRAPAGETLLGLHAHPGPLPPPDRLGTWIWLKVDAIPPVRARLAESGVALLGDETFLGPGTEQAFVDTEGNVMRLYAPLTEVRREVRIDAPPAAVFDALVEPEQIEAWFATIDDVALEPRVGGRVSFIDPLFGRVVGSVTALEPARRLAFSFSENWPTTLVFELAAEGDGTRLTVVQSGFHAIEERDFGIPGLVERLDAALAALAARPAARPA